MIALNSCVPQTTNNILICSCHIAERGLYLNNNSSPLQVNREQQIYKVTLIGFFANMLLSAGKLAAGIIGRSDAMIADGVHSISDFATDLVVMIFVKVSAMPKDEDHDYGHGKFET